MVNVATNRTTPKLLFVLSNDFGELSTALHLAGGLNCTATLLAPGRLAGLGAAGRHTPRVYVTADDVRAVADAERPDVVFLCSGYLYAVNNLFDLPALSRLLDALQQRGCPVVTTDPFLGLMAQSNGATFSAQHPLAPALARHFAEVYAVLREVPHLYPTDPTDLAPPRKLAFAIPCAAPAPDAWNDRAPDRSWLFVLSNEDYGGQLRRHGATEFHRSLCALLDRTLAQGRAAVLVAPAPCVDALRATAPQGATLLAHCGHDRFTDLLRRAEHVFFWNIISNAMTVRALDRRSSFFFNPGHLLTAIPVLYDLAVRHYFAGYRPEILDPSDPFDAATLAQRAAAQDEALGPARAAVARLPQPAGLIARLLAGGGDAA